MSAGIKQSLLYTIRQIIDYTKRTILIDNSDLSDKAIIKMLDEDFKEFVSVIDNTKNEKSNMAKLKIEAKILHGRGYEVDLIVSENCSHGILFELGDDDFTISEDHLRYLHGFIGNYLKSRE